MVLLKSNGTLFQLDITLLDWLTLDGTTLTEIQTSPMWPYTAGSCLLTDVQVALPSFVRDMPGDYMHPLYGFTNQWLKYVQDRASAAQAPSGSSGPGPNLGGPDVAMSSPTVSLKVVITAGGTWTPALRAETTAPVFSVENPMVALIQQVAAQTSGPAQTAFVTVPASGQQQPQPLLVQPATTMSESHSTVPPLSDLYL